MRAATTEWTPLDSGVTEPGITGSWGTGSWVADEALAESGVTDDELAALALAADPDVAVDRDAPSLFELVSLASDPLLPDWYMPALPGGRSLARPWQRRVVLFLVSAFLLIEGYGLCTTYGPIGPS